MFIFSISIPNSIQYSGFLAPRILLGYLNTGPNICSNKLTKFLTNMYETNILILVPIKFFYTIRYSYMVKKRYLSHSVSNCLKQHKTVKLSPITYECGTVQKTYDCQTVSNPYDCQTVPNIVQLLNCPWQHSTFKLSKTTYKYKPVPNNIDCQNVPNKIWLSNCPK